MSYTWEPTPARVPWQDTVNYSDSVSGRLPRKSVMGNRIEITIVTQITIVFVDLDTITLNANNLGIS